MKKKVSLIYIGRRHNWITGEISDVFLEGKKERRWSKLGGYLFIGSRYEAEADGDRITINKRPKEVGEGIDDRAKIEEWKVLDLASDAFAAKKRAATKIGKMNFFKNKNLEQLAEIRNRLTYEEKSSFDNAVLKILRELK